MCPPMEYDDYFPGDYRLLCPATGQIQYVFPYPSNLLNFFAEKSAPWLWATFARPVADANRNQTFHGQDNPRAKPARLEQLPNELLDEILDLLSDSKHDFLSLGLSSTILWPVVLHRIHQSYANSVALWAGKRIAFQGQYSPFTDTQLRQYGMDKSMHHEHEKRHSRFKWITSPEQEWHRVINDSRKSWAGFSPEAWADIEADISMSYMWPQDRVWILRNLTTSEFVRSDKLRPSKESIPQHHDAGFFYRMGLEKMFRRKNSSPQIANDTSPVSLGQVFLLLTCYSSCVPWAEYPFRFQNGNWNGCAIDLVPLDVHLAGTNAMEWADVSELVVDDVGNLRWWVKELEGGFSKKNHSRLWEKVIDERDLFHRWEGEGSASRPAKDEPYRFFRKRAQTGILISLGRSS